MIKETQYYTLLSDGRVRCDLCPRGCSLRNGQIGLCSVRGAAHDQIYLLSYGEASGFCIDPIEKKPLNHFLPGTPILSFGQVGCNLTCRFCQNWNISKQKSEHLQSLLDEVLLVSSGKSHEPASKPRQIDKLTDEASPLMIAKAAVQTGCKSVAFTYNDPVIFAEYAIDVAAACREQGIKTVAVTAGYISEAPRAEFFRHMDAANVDLKSFTDDFYTRLCSARLQPVLDTLLYLKHETKVWLEITTLLIPGENDSEAEINALTNWVVEKLGPGVPLHFSAFHPDWKMMDKPETSLAALQKARHIALGNGVRYAYIGNAHDPKSDSTYCHQCGAMLIERDWYELFAWGLTDDGHCAKCHAKCAGVFNGPPGNWGRKRQPLTIRRN